VVQPLEQRQGAGQGAEPWMGTTAGTGAQAACSQAAAHSWWRGWAQEGSLTPDERAGGITAVNPTADKAIGSAAVLKTDTGHCPVLARPHHSYEVSADQPSCCCS
jgi:hypothetical protein